MFPIQVGAPLFVLDVSVPLTWLVTQRGTAYTFGVLGRMALSTVVVPGSWPLAMAGAVLEAERRGLKSEVEVNQFLAGFANFRLLVDGQPPTHGWADVLPTARRYRASVPDAVYLELAARLALPLATTDARLTRAAAAAGVPIFTP
jgi:predicted nucleic acid-binding protein